MWLKPFTCFRVLLAFVLIAAWPTVALARAEVWVEVQSPHFTVVSDAGEKQARHVASQFELFRQAFHKVIEKLRVDPSQPVMILAVKNEKSLKELLPQFWEKKGLAHPDGIFYEGSDKQYIVLQTNATEENPYHVVYHEYVHLLLHMNFERIPVWLDEGLAEFFAYASLSEKEVGLGRPSQWDLQLLQESRMIPVEEVLAADHSSPLYNESKQNTMFYAESWALTHYMMVDERKGHMQQLQQFLDLVQQGDDIKQAFEKIFGDLKDFQGKFTSYIRQPGFYYYHVKTALEVDEKSLAAREISAAESDAVRGDFFVHSNRPVEARAMLEDAIKLAPDLAEPRESLGMLAYREGKLDEARKWFAEAVRLDSRNFLAFYYDAMLSSQGQLTPERIAHAESGLRHTLELNPHFAPAYSTLAQFYALRGEKLDDALALARKAVELEPGILSHRLALAQVLVRMDKAQEAETLVRRVLAAARNPRDRFMAEQSLKQIQQYRTFLAEQKRRAEELKQYEEEVRAQRSESQTPAEPAAGAVTVHAASQPSGSPPTSPSPVSASTPTAPGEGRVEQVSCSGKSLDATLVYAGFPLKLHSEDFSKIQFHLPKSLERGFDPCRALKGRYVQVEYHIAAGKSYDGEIVSLEVRR